ncbi:MAG: hypothetical protein WA208_16425 [Thermoanaerobaculia bacterium]
MSVLTRKRLLVTLFASLAVSTTLFANPSPRTQARMAYDPSAGNTVLFGGLAPFDHATQVSHEIGETWVFGSSRWIQQFPADSPSARAAHMMVTDTVRSRVVLFGGRTNGTTDLNDTWTWQNGNWSQVTTATAPDARQLAGMAFDRVRNRVVLFGGTRYSADKLSLDDLTDTWEFDGTTWQQRATSGPDVTRPILAYDAARNQTILVGLNAESVTQMYAYNPGDATWTKLTPERMPLCVNEGSMVYMDHAGTVLLVGGGCAITTDVAFTWDGTAWNVLETTTKIDQIYGQAMTYDLGRSTVIMVGAATLGDPPTGATYVLAGGDWTFPSDITRPRPRSLAAFVSDPVTKSIWMYGGLEQHGTGYLDDFWQYRNGQWYKLAADPAPTNCGMPLAVFDSDRNKVVLNCAGDSMWEFDVNASTWASFTNLSEKPGSRRFAHMAYDPQLKKTVFFGGLETYEYKNDTWLWDGTKWSQIKKDKADARGLGMMWYDASLKKVVLYGGLGRPRPEDTVRRYGDMWSFDTTKGWTKITVATTPGERYGALTTIDPRTGRTILFGGIRVDQIDETIRRQVYGDDMWEWNGTAWTRLSPSNVPPARENGMFAYDPSSNNFVIFGGYAGYYRSDIWTSPDLMVWKPITDSVERRRVVRR